MAKKFLKKHLYVLILCGGGGTRLWPTSRNRTPKQFSKLFGGETLFQKTVKRISGLVDDSHIFIITTGSRYASEVEKETPQISKNNIICEPMRRNTAMAHGLGALYIYKKDPQATIINLYSDHLVLKEKEFRQIELVAAKTAFLGSCLVAIGVKPTTPHTGLGYIHLGKIYKKEGNLTVYKVAEFTEKPSFLTAKRFFLSGQYCWNAGLYVWTAKSFLEAIKKYSPATNSALEKISRAIGEKGERKMVRAAYESAPDISVDYAVSEKVRNFLVLPADIGWSDVGDWKVIWGLSDKDDQGNVIIGHGHSGLFTGLDSRNNLIQYSNKHIAVIGVENMIIIQTSDVILVCRRDRAEDVRKLVEVLKDRGKLEYL